MILIPPAPLWSRIMRQPSIALTALVFLVAIVVGVAPASELPNLAYDPGEVGQVIGRIHSDNGLLPSDGSTVMGINQVLFYKGHMLAPIARNAARRGSGSTRGAMSVFDISNPRSPQRVFWRQDNLTNEIREAHGHVLSSGDIWCINAINGVQFWNVADPRNPVLLSDMRVNGMSGTDTYGRTGWWVAGQHPYYYLGAVQSGLAIIDASNPSSPTLTRMVSSSTFNMSHVGSVHLMGNLLILGSAGGGHQGGSTRRIAVADISDPVNPVLLDSRASLGNYSAGVYGTHITSQDHGGQMQIWDMSDPSDLTLIREFNTGYDGDFLYTCFQAGYFHAPHFRRYRKHTWPDMDLLLQTANGPLRKTYEFTDVVGNLIVGTGGGDGDGAKFVPHQAAKWTVRPEINAVNPAAGSVHRATTSRIGVSITDNIDFTKVSTSTFRVRPVGGSAIAGHFSWSRNHLNFTPAQPLAANTTYEIVIIENGITDLVGNGIRPFTSTFSTGAGGEIYRQVLLRRLDGHRWLHLPEATAGEVEGDHEQFPDLDQDQEHRFVPEAQGPQGEG